MNGCCEELRSFFFLRIPFAVLFRSLQVVAKVEVDLEIT